MKTVSEREPGSRGRVPRSRGRVAGPSILGVVSLLILPAVALPGCSGEDGDRRVQVGEPAPSFQAATLDGTPVSLDDLRGEVVLLNLWATWCAPCRRETPFLQSLYERHGERGLELVGVSVDNRGAERQVRRFVEEFDVTYTILHDPAKESMDRFSALGLPATYLIDREGVIRFLRMGPVGETDADFLNALEEALS